MRLSCRTAQAWLQAPEDLPPERRFALRHHLDGCPECAAVERDRARVDALLVESFLTAPPVPSVRASVRATIQQERQRRPRRLSLRPVLRAVPLAAVAFVVTLILTQVVPQAGNETQVAGAAWHPVRSDIGFPVTADRAHPDHLLAGAFGEVFESWNAGQTWKPLGHLPPGLAIRAVLIDSSRPRDYLVATLHSVFLSKDGGLHWRETAASLRGAENMFLQQDPAHPAVFYLGPSILWKSTDHGNTWTPAGAGRIFAPWGIQALEIPSRGTLFTAIWGGGVAVSHDGGATWETRARGLQKDAMDVVSDGTALWAATKTGLYASTDGGLHWSPGGPDPHFFATSLLAGPGYILAGGNGLIYRSADGGKHWSYATAGLPLYPYVNSLVADPFHPSRVYASLNTDGLFRSDDGGQHWAAINVGLPLTGSTPTAPMLLFLRGGALWLTTTAGSDPGDLTVERDVRLAALAPDAGSAAYVAGSHGAWAVRLINAGGSAPYTVLVGRGALPRRLLWAPDSLRLAIVESGAVHIVQAGRTERTIPLSPGVRVLGWSRDGRTLLLWNGARGTVTMQSWRTPASSTLPVHFLARPHPAPDGRAIASLSGASLSIGTWQAPGIHGVSVSRGCTVRGWSEDSARLLLLCADGAQIFSRQGVRVARLAAPSGSLVAWSPGANDTLLVYRNGDLWRLSLSGKTQLLVQDARPAFSGEQPPGA